MSWPVKVSYLAEEPKSLDFFEAISSLPEKITVTLLPTWSILREMVPSVFRIGGLNVVELTIGPIAMELGYPTPSYD